MAKYGPVQCVIDNAFDEYESIENPPAGRAYKAEEEE